MMGSSDEIYELRRALEEAEKARDAALADVSQLREEFDAERADRLNVEAHRSRLLDDRDAAIARAEAATAQAAAMRGALKQAIAFPVPYRHNLTGAYWHREPHERPCVGCDLEDALNDDAGRALLERLRAAEKAYDAVVSQLAAERAAHAATRAELDAMRSVNDGIRRQLGEAQHDRDALREEVARLREGINELAGDALEAEKETRDVEAKLGRTVAALREALPFVDSMVSVTAADIELVRARLRAILADPDSAAAGDAWTAMEKALREIAKPTEAMGSVAESMLTLFRMKARTALAAVDARRGGVEGGA